MNEPDDPDALSPALRALLDVERRAAPAPAAARARMLAAASAQLFGPPPGGPGGQGGQGGQGGGQGGAKGGQGSTPGSAAPSAAPAGGSVASGAVSAWAPAAVVKLAVGVGVASFGVGGLVGAGIQARVTQPTPPAFTAPVAAAPPEVVRAPEPVVAVREPVAAPAPPSARVVAPKPVAPPSAPDGLGEERSLVDQARSAMLRGDNEGALAVLVQHEQRFANGKLVEERMALEVHALAALGRTDQARAVATLFRMQFPAGLFRAGVDAVSPP